MIELRVEIINKLGLHARAAAKFVQTTAAFSSDICVMQDDKLIDAKSIMSVMMLAASKGSTLHITVDGNDEQQAAEAITELINNRFGEDE